MAKDKDEKKKPEGSIPLPARFEIRTPALAFRGQRVGTVEAEGGKRRNWKINFMDGVGWTDDEAAAQACAEWGYQVTDHATGETVNKLPPPDEKPAKGK